MSSSKRTRHIRHRYFLIKDRIDQGDLTVKYCPTEDMWADVMTKPLQEAHFRRMRSILMNIPVNYDDDKERARTHPDLLPEEDDGVKYLPPIPGRGEVCRSNPRCTADTGKDRRSVLSDRSIADLSKRELALLGKSKSASEARPERGIIKRGRKPKVSSLRKAGPRSGHV